MHVRPQGSEQQQIAIDQPKRARYGAMALANKAARIAWAILIRGETYRAPTIKAAA